MVGRDGRRAGRSASRANSPSARTYSCVQWTTDTARSCFCKIIQCDGKSPVEMILIDPLYKAHAAAIRLFNPIAHSKLTSSSCTTFTFLHPQTAQICTPSEIFLIHTEMPSRFASSRLQKTLNAFVCKTEFGKKTITFLTIPFLSEQNPCKPTGQKSCCALLVTLTASYLDRCSRDGFYACDKQLSSL